MGAVVRVGIISAAWGARAHLPAWRAVPGVEVVAICTAHRETAEAAAQTHDIAMPFWDAAEMARHPDVDIVDVGTRPDMRRDMCLAALGAGKHVYNGIPFAACWEDSIVLHEAARVSGTVAVVDAYSEFLAPLRFVEELLGEGTCGEVQSITGRLDVSLFDRPVSTFPYNWFADGRHGASALNNLGSHLLHLLVRYGGPAADASGVTTRFVDEWRYADTGTSVRPDCDDTAAGVVRFESGVLGQFHVAWAAASAPGFRLEIAGNRGRIVVTAAGTMPSEGAAISVARDHGALEEVDVPVRLRVDSGIEPVEGWLVDPRPALALAFGHMVGAMAGTHEARPSFERAHHVQGIIEAVQRSSAERTWVRPLDASGDERSSTR